MTFIKYIVIIMVFVGISGCSVQYSFTGASIPTDTKTVSIYDFPNLAPLINPTLTNTFMEALKDKFVSLTRLQLVAEYGDLEFSGAIVDYRTQPIAIQANSDEAAQNRLTISVKVKFTNAQNPKANFDNTFSRFADYDSDRDLSQVESALVDEILVQLIDDIYNKAVVNW